LWLLGRPGIFSARTFLPANSRSVPAFESRNEYNGSGDNMTAFINQPKRIPLILKLGIWVSEKITGKTMLPARILAHYPKAALGSGIMESLVAHEDGAMTQRLLKLIRMTASHTAACPFCIDMNSYEYRDVGITDAEAEALRGDFEQMNTFSEREKLAITYTRVISQTPLKFHPDLVERVKSVFTEREFVILASTAAQVNYWARLIQALGIPPAGFGDE
jgi:alkylhydroperoxidase family enzyme